MQVITDTPKVEVIAQPIAPEQVISAFCDCCGNHDYGTRDELKAKGWGLYGKAQFCPAHENEI